MDDDELRRVENGAAADSEMMAAVVRRTIEPPFALDEDVDVALDVTFGLVSHAEIPPRNDWGER